jgi:hypothetical protein
MRNIRVVIKELITIDMMLSITKPIDKICKINLHLLILSFGGGRGVGQLHIILL